MSQSGFNLEKLKDVVNEGELAAHPELISLLSATATTSQPHLNQATASAVNVAANISQLGVTSTFCNSSKAIEAKKAAAAAASKQQKKPPALALPTDVDLAALSSKEIERDRGKPLSKFDRNVMIFDWLHTLDENATIDLT
jgi:hypothetical protein